MRKKIGTLAAACALAACVGLFGCSSGGSEAPSGEKPDEAAQAAQKEPEQKESKYAVSIDECTVGQDYAGKAAIVVTYTFTNNAEKAVPFFTAVSAKAFQNGVQLDTAIVSDIDSQSSMNEIKPGATTTVQQAYLLDDQSQVSVECTELISLDDTVLAEKTFDVA